jgi:hypothetical protein
VGIRNQLVSGMDGVAASGLQCLPQAEGALVNVETEVIAVGLVAAGVICRRS